MAQDAGISFSPTTEPGKDELQALDRGLTSYNRMLLGSDASPFFIFLKEKGHTLGGVACSVRPDTLLIKSLWVDESCRGQGYGRKLVEECQKKAAAAGCSKIVVDTMSYQAPDFYRKLGYEDKGIIQDYYNGFDRLFFEKRLQT